MKRDTRNMDMTVGDPRRLMIVFAIPMLLSNLFQQFYGMVDAAIVGRGIGISAMGAIGTTGSLTYLIIGFLGGMSYGFAVLFAQHFGAKDFAMLRKAFCGSIRLTVLLSLIFTGFSVAFAPQLLRLINVPDDIFQDAYTYIIVIFSAIPLTLIYDVLGSFLRSVGDSKSPLYAMIMSTIVNIILDLRLVLWIPLGVFGAAIATVTAQLVAAVYCFIMIRKTGLLKFEKGDWRIDLQIDAQLMKLGLPLAFQTSVTALGEVALQRLVNNLGSLYTAGYSAAGRVAYFAEVPGSCLGVAMATYAGQNMGARKIDRIRKGVRDVLPLSIGINLILGVVMYLLVRPLTSVFANADEIDAILPIVTEHMMITALMKWVLGPLFIYRNALQGMGDTTVPMLSGFLELAIRIAVAYLVVDSLGFKGICWAGVAAWIGAEVMLMIAYYRKIHKVSAES